MISSTNFRIQIVVIANIIALLYNNYEILYDCIIYMLLIQLRKKVPIIPYSEYYIVFLIVCDIFNENCDIYLPLI